MNGADDQRHGDDHGPDPSPAADGRLAAFVLEDGRVRLASGPVTSVFPGADARPAGDDFHDRLGAVLADEDAAAIREAARDGDVHRRVITVESDGTTRHYRYEEYPIEADAGERLVVCEDATRSVERAERHALFETLVGRAQDGLYATDADGRVVSCNESLCSLLDADRESLVGREATTLLAEPDRSQWRDAVDELTDGEGNGDSRELDYRAADGDRVPLSVHLSPRGESDGVVAAVRDVSEREARERRLEQYRTLVESAGDPMWVLDESGRITLCNDAMCSLLDADRETVVGASVDAVVPEPAATRIADALATLRTDTDREWHSIDLAVRGASGNRRHFEVTLGPIRDGDALAGSVGTFREVTDRRRQAEKLALLERVFAVVVRHDIADSARAIRDDADELVDVLDGREAEMAAKMRERCGVLARTAEKSAAVERVVDADPDPTGRDLATLVETGVDAVADANPAGTVSVDVPDDVSVLAIPGIDLAVRNLVENALVHAGRAPDVGVTATVEGERVDLTVADDGPGVPAAELAALERGSETALEHASGVGLWLVNWVAEKSGGELTFDADSTGTRATIRLPRHRSRPAAGTDDGADTNADDGGTTTGVAGDEGDITLLHVDADETTLAAVREAAADADRSVAVDSATSAIAAVEALPAADCVVADCLDGDWAELVDAVTARDVPLVLYTDDHASLDGATRSVVDSVVEKGTPATSASFLVEKALAVSRSEAADDSGSPGAGDGVATAPDAVTTLVSGDTERWRRSDGDVPASVEPGPGETRVGERRTATVDGDRRHYRVDRLPLAAVDDADGAASEPTAAGESRSWQLTRVRDATEAVRRDERVALSVLLVEHARDGISAVDANGHIEYHNPSFASLLGHEDMVGEHAAAFMAEGELKKGQRAVQRVMATPGLDSEVLDMDFVTADGGEVTLAVHFAPRRVDGEYAGLVNVARDVTERKARERRLEQYRTLVESAGDPMVVFDPEGEVELCNAAFARHFDRPRADVRGREASALFRDEALERWRSAVERLRRADEETASFDVTLPASDGDRRHFEVTVGVIREAGGFAGSVCTCRDVTERERRTDELELLKQVLGRVLRHDLRNELTLVQGHAGMLAEATDGHARALAGDIVDRSERLARTSESARAAEAVLDSWDDVDAHSLASVVESAVDSLDVPVRVDRDVPAEVRVSAHRALPQAIEHLVVALADTVADRGSAPESDDDAVRVRLQAGMSDGGGRLRVSLPDRELPRSALSSFEAAPPALLDRERDVARWLVAWVVDRSDGRLRVEADPVPTVVVTLPTPADG